MEKPRTGNTVEHLYRIWDDIDGEYIEIGDDRDALDLTEIRYCSRQGEVESAILMNDEQLSLLITGLIERRDRKEQLCPQKANDDDRTGS